MNRVFLLVAFLGIAAMSSVQAQETPDTATQEKKFYIIEEEFPEFIGGDVARVKFLAENLQYPEEAKEANLEGRAVVGFVVEPDGSITNVEIAKSSGYSILDEEAIRVVQSMPNWKPGKQDGEAVRVRFTMPITFTLDDKKPKLEDDKKAKKNK